MKELNMMGEPTANSWTNRIGDYLEFVFIYACRYVVWCYDGAQGSNGGAAGGGGCSSEWDVGGLDCDNGPVAVSWLSSRETEFS